MKSDAAIVQQAILRCEGLYHSSCTLEAVYRQYHAYTGSREFYRLLVRLLDSNIERLAELTDVLEDRSLSPKVDVYMNRAKGKTWEVLEDITRYAKETFREDLWHDPDTFPTIPRQRGRPRLDALP